MVALWWVAAWIPLPWYRFENFVRRVSNFDELLLILEMMLEEFVFLGISMDKGGFTSEQS